MPRRGELPPTPTADRLAQRAEPGGLHRRGVSGGDVFAGSLATRALQALGARAMTVDNSIVVNDQFNEHKPEDKALLAHEQYHLRHSGGEGAHEARDGEEIAARSVERMVLHTSTGGVESHEAGHQRGGTGVPSTPNAESGGARSGQHHKGPNASRGFGVLVSRGLNRDQILQMMLQQVMHGLEQGREHADERHAGKKGLL